MVSRPQRPAPEASRCCARKYPAAQRIHVTNVAPTNSLWVLLKVRSGERTHLQRSYVAGRVAEATLDFILKACEVGHLHAVQGRRGFPGSRCCPGCWATHASPGEPPRLFGIYPGPVQRDKVVRLGFEIAEGSLLIQLHRWGMHRLPFAVVANVQRCCSHPITRHCLNSVLANVFCLGS